MLTAWRERAGRRRDSMVYTDPPFDRSNPAASIRLSARRDECLTTRTEFVQLTQIVRLGSETWLGIPLKRGRSSDWM
jgi:hypothetical protein